ncbi:diacylglycerol/lipid kinase family protein [Candidatus Viridilinea mediisalina]|uniref:Diacylglycerol kinase n=1 Tax=Candidatus Viridilinea mediisalina TaxID=2024553 RepID=A0A2A6RDS9_9CHLR|nr:diacylglycerol kinase family protein [Candidatus Viridilinea mediisalina]PDW00829.1 diacylglycerol kinase [Candidatus Viridilinea mediisalina]
MKFSIILNPAAGRGAAGRRRQALESLLRAAGLDYTLVTTHARGGATELTYQALQQGATCVVAVGGDGTINEVVNGLLGGRQQGLGAATLGIVPLGTGSDFAKVLPGAKVGDLASAVQGFVKGATRPVDLGVVRFKAGNQQSSRAFINGLGAGLDALVAVEVAKLRWLTGLPAYIAASLRALAIYRPATMRVAYAGHELHEPLLFATVGNGRYQGGGFQMTPTGKIDDGLLDLCAVKQLPLSQIVRYYPKLIVGSHIKLPVVTTAQIRKLTMSSTQPFPVATDGEVVATDATHVQVEVLAGAVELVGYTNYP